MIVEKPKRGGLVSHTIGCILADQFVRLKQGDRYYYELGNGQSPYAFTRRKYSR